MLFLSRGQKCHQVQCFCCPEVRNAIKYNAFIVLKSNMLKIVVIYQQYYNQYLHYYTILLAVDICMQLSNET